jgi:hypothetical protein
LPEVAKVITFAGIFVLMKPSRGENMAREGFCPAPASSIILIEFFI